MNAKVSRKSKQTLGQNKEKGTINARGSQNNEGMVDPSHQKLKQMLWENKVNFSDTMPHRYVEYRFDKLEKSLKGGLCLAGKEDALSSYHMKVVFVLSAQSRWSEIETLEATRMMKLLGGLIRVQQVMFAKVLSMFMPVNQVKIGRFVRWENVFATDIQSKELLGFSTIRLLLALAAIPDMVIHQMDRYSFCCWESLVGFLLLLMVIPMPVGLIIWRITRLQVVGYSFLGGGAIYWASKETYLYTSSTWSLNLWPWLQPEKLDIFGLEQHKYIIPGARVKNLPIHEHEGLLYFRIFFEYCIAVVEIGFYSVGLPLVGNQEQRKINASGIQNNEEMVNPSRQNLKQKVGENQGLLLVGNQEQRKINASGIQNNEEMVNPSCQNLKQKISDHSMKSKNTSRIWYSGSGPGKGAFERLDSQNPSTNNDRHPINKEHGYFRFQDKESVIHEDNVTMENLYWEDHQEHEIDDYARRIVGDDSQTFITKGGCVVRQCVVFDGRTWKKQPDLLKQDITSKTTEHSDFKSTCPLMARAIKTQLASHHKTKQYILHKHYLRYPTKEEATTHPPNGVKVAEWVLLCDRFASEEFQLDLQNEEASSSCTPVEICIEKLEKEKSKQLEKDHLELKENHLKLQKDHVSLTKKVDYLLKHFTTWQSPEHEDYDNEDYKDYDEAQDDGLLFLPETEVILEQQDVTMVTGMEGQTLTADDQLSFNQNSMNFPDQFQNMRLEINEMSHEEGMFECLSEQVYCSIDRIHEEASYPICLEGYKNGEKVGKMKKCGPVCKSECSNQA
ncbi:hypothetical protein Tco_1482669 [Tanacetum coccineum]